MIKKIIKKIKKIKIIKAFSKDKTTTSPYFHRVSYTLKRGLVISNILEDSVTSTQNLLPSQLYKIINMLLNLNQNHNLNLLLNEIRVLFYFFYFFFFFFYYFLLFSKKKKFFNNIAKIFIFQTKSFIYFFFFYNSI